MTATDAGTMRAAVSHGANDVRLEEVPRPLAGAGLGAHRIVTTLCPGGKERMRRLIEMVRSGRLDLRPLLTHRFKLADLNEAYKLFGERRDGVIKVAITP